MVASPAKQTEPWKEHPLRACGSRVAARVMCPSILTSETSPTKLSAVKEGQRGSSPLLPCVSFRKQGDIPIMNPSKSSLCPLPVGALVSTTAPFWTSVPVRLKADSDSACY